MEDIFEKRRIKVGKNEDENIQLFIKNGCRFQNLIISFQNSNMQFLFSFIKRSQRYKREFDGM